MNILPLYLSICSAISRWYSPRSVSQNLLNVSKTVCFFFTDTKIHPRLCITTCWKKDLQKVNHTYNTVESIALSILTSWVSPFDYVFVWTWSKLSDFTTFALDHRGICFIPAYFIGNLENCCGFIISAYITYIASYYVVCYGYQSTSVYCYWLLYFYRVKMLWKVT